MRTFTIKSDKCYLLANVILMQIRLYATLRQIVGTKIVEVPVQTEKTVGDLLRSLVQQYPKLDESIWYPNGSLAGHVAVILNGRDIRHLKGVDTPITDDDILDVFPPVGGGSGKDDLTHVTLKFTSHFRKQVGHPLIEFTFKGNTPRQLIPALLEQFEIEDLLFKDGELRPNVRFVIDGRYSYLLGGQDAHIPDGAIVVLVYSWGGRYTSH
jgi:molybdopterin synthase sulfur carrier subunit